MKLADFPRIELAHLPTPLQPMSALSKHLGGPDIYVKRDDCTGLAGGGNKTRKLEYLMADALQQGADTIVTVGATQSNHVRQTVAAAAKLGLKIEVLLERTVVRDDDYAHNGNLLLDQIMGATIHHCDPGEDMDVRGQAFADKLAAEGRNTYFIPTGGSSVVGTLGYSGCVSEILTQSAEMGIEPDALVVASGSQGTQAGMLVGLALEGSDIPLHGISVSRPREDLEERVHQLALDTLAYAKLDVSIERDQVICDDGYYAPAYGVPNDAMVEAVTLCAQTEGMLFDPVYTGKAMAGLIDKIRNGTFRKGQTVVFVHTGGQAALHAYRSVFSGD
ncbi:MAG: D-cysteine desulfhydrase [Pseudomonadota bacterium]